MAIETDNELNFLPEEVEWGINRALKQGIYALITVFLIGAGTILIGLISLKGMSLAPREGEHQQSQEIQQPIINNQTIAQPAAISEPIPEPELDLEPTVSYSPTSVESDNPIDIPGLIELIDALGKKIDEMKSPAPGTASPSVNVRVEQPSTLKIEIDANDLKALEKAPTMTPEQKRRYRIWVLRE